MVYLAINARVLHQIQYLIRILECVFFSYFSLLKIALQPSKGIPKDGIQTYILQIITIKPVSIKDISPDSALPII